jgi:hypothetical protein
MWSCGPQQILPTVEARVEPSHDTANTKKSPARQAGAVVGLLTLGGASLWLGWIASFLVGWNCSLGMDTNPVPAPASASPQGWLCGEHTSGLALTIFYGAYVLATAATVVLTHLCWRRWTWRVGLPAAVVLLVALPWAATTLIQLPSDDCTAHARATHPAWACERSI